MGCREGKGRGGFNFSDLEERDKKKQKEERWERIRGSRPLVKLLNYHRLIFLFG